MRNTNIQANKIVEGMRAESAKILADEKQPMNIEARLAALMVELIGNGTAEVTRAARPTESASKLAKPVRLCQFKVSLDGIRPQIWRRLVVPRDIPLEMFHELLQITMGWTNSHLHKFVTAEGTSFRLVTDDGFDGLEEDEADEDGATLDMLIAATGDSFQYTYDFGDDWTHTVKLEKSLPFYAVPMAPICLDGANAVPPEDCGGVSGYRDLRKVLANPKH
ncbi:plasmid pRiA4b ORF-3 family protein, partial [Silvimonas sp.]|uniref:plasmid pRiA4b ORF-3 family protein n=1 Tax=Silvimonas sp. TaxID=2650811 RepID=UPI00284C4D6A